VVAFSCLRCLDRAELAAGAGDRGEGESVYLGLNVDTNTANFALSTASAGVGLMVPLGLISTGVGAPVGAALLAGQAILSGIGIRSGANEADAIVPAQNAIGARLKEINAGIGTASIPTLQAWFNELQATAAEFRKFVTDPRFTDGRASTQALNTLMPLIDGTDASGYPCELNAWGNPCNGGTIGTIQRQLYTMGSNIGPPMLTQGAGSMGASLQYQLPGLPYLPQSGTIPPTSPYSTIRAAGIGVVPSSMGAGDLLPLALLGGLAVWFFSGRRGA
jgi:hypothetical protein